MWAILSWHPHLSRPGLTNLHDPDSAWLSSLMSHAYSLHYILQPPWNVDSLPLHTGVCIAWFSAPIPLPPTLHVWLTSQCKCSFSWNSLFSLSLHTNTHTHTLTPTHQGYVSLHWMPRTLFQPPSKHPSIYAAISDLRNSMPHIEWGILCPT